MRISDGSSDGCSSDLGLTVTEVAAHTGSPEILDGRVKTLHPKIQGGLLARRDSAQHLKTLEEHGIDRIDLLVVNLYPFRQTIAKSGCPFADAVDNIDIGGPAMFRADARRAEERRVGKAGVRHVKYRGAQSHETNK